MFYMKKNHNDYIYAFFITSIIIENMLNLSNHMTEHKYIITTRWAHIVD